MSTEDIPLWLATEENVAHFFSLHNFRVEKISISGRQIDLVATRDDSLALAPETWNVEITVEYVDVTKGSKDSQKLLLANKTNGGKMMLVSLSGFTDDQRATLKQLQIVPLTYAELESRILNLSRYAEAILVERRGQAAAEVGFDPSVFIEPYVKVQGSPSVPESSTKVKALAWVDAVVRSSAGLLGAMLGDLGTGKTTILQYAQMKALEEFIKDPSVRPVPVYVPLSRYKHHSGHVDSLLQEVFANSGTENYPSGLIRYLVRTGRVVLFFDGLDEVHPILGIDDVVQTVTRMLDYLGKDGRAIISSRTHLFASRSEELAIFGPYERAKIGDVAAKLKQLLANHATSQLAHLDKFTQDQIDEYLRRTCGTDYERVKGYVDSVYGFRDMASTPVLLAMMRRTIPLLVREKHEFGLFPHLELYAAYTDRWIARDEGRAQLSPAQRSSLSQTLAESLIRRDEYAATWAEVVEILRDDPAWKEKPISESAAEADIRNSTFLVREDPGQFRFVHRSIMEYFAAGRSIDRIVGSARGEDAISDGHAEFMALILAQRWVATGGTLPFARSEYNLDDWADAALLALVGRASLNFPETVRSSLQFPRLSNIRAKGRELKTLALKNVAVEHLTIECQAIESISFLGCQIRGVRINAGRVGKIRFEGCDIETSQIQTDKESWGRITILPTSMTATDVNLLPTGFRIASEWVDNSGCRASIDSMDWDVGTRPLIIMEELARRLGSGKRSIDSFRSDPVGRELVDLLSVLKREDIVAEDESRVPHQLGLGSVGRNIVGGLRTNPRAFSDALKRIGQAPRSRNKSRSPKRRSDSSPGSDS